MDEKLLIAPKFSSKRTDTPPNKIPTSDFHPQFRDSVLIFRLVFSSPFWFPFAFSARVCILGLSLCSGVLKLLESWSFLFSFALVCVRGGAGGGGGVQSDTRILGPTLFVSLTGRDFLGVPKWSGSLQLFLLCAVW